MSTRVLPEFELLMPKNTTEAVTMLSELRDQAAIMAGGTDLLVMLKNGYRTKHVISLRGIPELHSIGYDPWKGLEIGAMATLAQVVESPVVKERYAALWQSAAQNGSYQTRYMGTVVGNILRASPSGDCCCAMLALGGDVILKGPQGIREVPIDQFWLDYRVTARKPDELALAVRLPLLSPETVSGFAAMTRTTLDLAKVNTAVRFDVAKSACKNVRIAMGAVAPTTLRLSKTEKLLEGAAVTDAVLKEVEKTAPTEISPIDDVRSTAEYRRTVAGILVRRLIEKTWNDARSGR